MYILAAPYGERGQNGVCLFWAARTRPTLPVVGNALVHLDGGHITIEYSRLPATAIGALADRTLAQS